MEVALVRYGEIALKSDRVRREMEQQLARNIEAQTGGRVFKRAARLIVVGGEWEKLSKVFGIVSWSPAMEVRADMEEIKEAALRLYSGGSFRISAQRVTKDFPLTSMEINKEVGAYIVEKTGAKVDLSNPDIDIGVEIIGKKAYIFRERVEGPGGLPVGVEGDVVLLFSGGIDSPVAGWLLGKRGVGIHPFHLFMGVDVENVLKKLWEWFPGEENLRVSSFDRDRLFFILKRLKAEHYYYMALKGIMYREAESYAKDIGAYAIATGETIGQVSSQTLHNLVILSRLVEIPVIRPLIGFDKEEVVSMAKRIGTYEESIKLKDPCADVKIKAVTRAREEILRTILEEYL